MTDQKTARVALVTGASGEIGSAISTALAETGFQVAIHFNTDGEGAERTKQACLDRGAKAETFQADLSQKKSAGDLISAIVSRFGKLSVLVNNAGALLEQFLLMMSDETWEAAIDLNLSSVYRVTKAALKPMMKERWGRIIQVSSLAGLKGDVRRTAYSAAKAGLLGFTKALAREVAGSRITVNAVCPGVVRTKLIKGRDEKYFETIRKRTPLERLGTPEDVAGLVVFLASDRASFITGAEISVDGGLGLTM